MFKPIEKMNAAGRSVSIASIGESNFQAEVLQAKQPILVAFSAPWSRPCQVLDPILEDLARACSGKAKVVKVDPDACLDLSLCYDIQSVPTLLCFVQGKPQLRIVGTATTQAILAKLRPFGIVQDTVASVPGHKRTDPQPGKEN